MGVFVDKFIDCLFALNKVRFISKSYSVYKLASFNRPMSYLGLINAIAFGVNKETLRRLNWGDMKVRCECFLLTGIFIHLSIVLFRILQM